MNPRPALVLVVAALLAPAASAQAPPVPQCAANGLALGNATVSIAADGVLCSQATGAAPQLDGSALGHAIVAAMRSHELGHNWGMSHDAAGNGRVTVKLTRTAPASTALIGIQVAPGAAPGPAAGPPGCSITNTGGEVEIGGTGVFCGVQLRVRMRLVIAAFDAAVADENPLFQGAGEGRNPFNSGKLSVAAGPGSIGNHKDVMGIALTYVAPDGTTSTATVGLLPAVQ
jgi:hypothetical protein